MTETDYALNNIIIGPVLAWQLCNVYCVNIIKTWDTFTYKVTPKTLDSKLNIKQVAFEEWFFNFNLIFQAIF